MSSFTHIAILGRQPELGLIELEALYGAERVVAYGRYGALVDGDVDVSRLGGTIKAGRILYHGKPFDLRELPLDPGALPRSTGKTPFALSGYGIAESAKSFMAAGLELKRGLRNDGPVRLIIPGKGLATSAAEIRHNRVIEDGFELIVAAARGEMILAQVTGVQDVDWYSKRDYGRPRRDADVGMLPPKLAQVLVNTAGGGPIWDPFCGTGVILQEALLLGQEAGGSDVSDEMIEATRTNLGWLEGERSNLPAWQVQKADAREVAVPAGRAIASEGYLGPHLTGVPEASRLNDIRSELRQLYQEALRHWASLLERGTEVSLCAPVWRTSKGWVGLDLVDDLPDLGYTLRVFERASNPVIYSRDDQVVGRQLLLIRKA